MLELCDARGEMSKLRIVHGRCHVNCYCAQDLLVSSVAIIPRFHLEASSNNSTITPHIEDHTCLPITSLVGSDVATTNHKAA
jgi:hypothetical protein